MNERRKSFSVKRHGLEALITVRVVRVAAAVTAERGGACVQSDTALAVTTSVTSIREIERRHLVKQTVTCDLVEVYDRIMVLRLSSCEQLGTFLCRNITAASAGDHGIRHAALSSWAVLLLSRFPHFRRYHSDINKSKFTIIWRHKRTVSHCTNLVIMLPHASGANSVAYCRIM